MMDCIAMLSMTVFSITLGLSDGGGVEEEEEEVASVMMADIQVRSRGESRTRRRCHRQPRRRYP